MIKKFVWFFECLSGLSFLFTVIKFILKYVGAIMKYDVWVFISIISLIIFIGCSIIILLDYLQKRRLRIQEIKKIPSLQKDIDKLWESITGHYNTHNMLMGELKQKEEYICVKCGQGYDATYKK